MRDLLRHPLTWLVAGEAAVVGALLGVGWYVFTLPSGPPALVVPSARPLLIEPSPSAKAAKKPPPTARPSPAAAGLPTGLAFPVDLDELNRDGASIEAAEATVIHGLETALLSYIDRVVVPAVLRAESDSAAKNAATMQSPAATRKTP